MSSVAPNNQESTRYTRLQIAIHWAVVLLVVEQWYTSQAIPRTHNPLLPPSSTDLLLHAVHNYAGLLIGALMLARIGLRLFQPRPASLHIQGWLERLSQVIHWGLYISLLGQVAAGFAAAYLWAPAGRIHILLWNVTLVLASLHIAAAAYHAVRCDGVVKRMVPWPR
ncbi:cytochrome b [Nitratireductor luteus]|uniref:cytochrome b n=1 Tax=Nitratireductor luteus TaxID=2976980 RepID=UPI00223F9A69|nr:cytochrome b/b6 domain-containing protein [Nitratireductor luteus]